MTKPPSGSLRLFVLALVVALLSACASIPMQGPVVQGQDVAAEPRLRFLASGPDAGDDPVAIVQGFLRAAVGSEDNHRVARSFLAGERRQSWRPNARVLVYPTISSVELTPVPTGELAAPQAGTVQEVVLTTPLSAVVDDVGRYREPVAEETASLTFTLQPVEGEWRIIELEDGLMLSSSEFTRFYDDFALYFANPSRTVLVPEVRWFSGRDPATSTALTAALLEGPSDWLAPAVLTAVPAGTHLAIDAVRVTDGVASVELSPEALEADQEQRLLLQVQLEQTLFQLSEIDAVEITVDGAPYLPDPGQREPTPVLTRNPGVQGGPVLLQEQRLVRLEGRDVVPVEGLPSFEGLDPASPAVALDESGYALLTQERSQLLYAVPSDDPSEPSLLLNGADLTPPSFDRHGWIWSTPAVGGGVAMVVRVPEPRVEIGPQGAGPQVVEVVAPWLNGRKVLSLRVSRGGARVLVVSLAEGQARLEVAGVVRNAEGRPVALGEPRRLAPDLVEAASAAWVDESTVVVLGSRAQDPVRPYLVMIGGLTSAMSAVEEARSVAAGNGERTIYVGTSGGRLMVRSGGGWVEVTTEGDVPLLYPTFPG